MKILKRFAAALFLLWCFVIFTVVMIVILPFILIVTFLYKGKAGHNAGFFFLRAWGWIVSMLCLFPVRTINRNVYKKDQAYIFISNHNSYLDSVAVVIAAPLPFKPLGKVEMNKVPIFGMIYRRMVIMVDRKSQENRKLCETHLRSELLKGQSILIFPEGTMNRSDEPLANFYDGAFRLAIDTQIPIAPMVIINARKLLPRNHPLQVKPGPITCVFSEPIDVKGLTQDDLPALKEKVYSIMQKAIEKAG